MKWPKEAALDALKEQLMDVVNSAGESKARLARMETLAPRRRSAKWAWTRVRRRPGQRSEGLEAELAQAQQVYEQAAQA